MEPEEKSIYPGKLELGSRVSRLAVEASVERLDTYEDNLQYYEERNYRYIPLPKDEKYYDRDKELVQELSDQQFINDDAPLRRVFERLQDHPFLLIDRASSLTVYFVSEDDYTLLPEEASDDAIELNADDIEREYPQIAEELNFVGENRYQIITLADLNRRLVGEELYPIIAELEDQLSQVIEEDVDESVELYSQLPPRIIGRREKDKLEDIEVHIVEYLGLKELKSLLKGRPHLWDEFGFSSPNECEDILNSINKTRNRVMHANRTLIRNEEDLEKTLERVDAAQEIIAEVHSIDPELTGA